MKKTFLTTLTLVIAACALPSRAASLCDAGEQTLFTCSVKASTKTISLCASPTLSDKAGYLQYRFGRPGNIELEFPKQRQNSQRQFRFAHYFRAQTDRIEVNFNNDGYLYSLYYDYEGEVRPAQTSSGISVTKDGAKKPVELACTHPASGKLGTLDAIVPCDKDNALNMGNCQ